MAQVIVNGLVAGSIHALVALGFSVIYNTVGFFHFAHGGVFTVAAYCFLASYSFMGLPFAVSAATACLAATLLGMAMERWVYRPISKSGGGSMVLLIAAFGMLIAVQNLIALVFGHQSHSVRSGPVVEGFSILGTKVTGIQIVIVAVALALVTLTSGIFRMTLLGREARSLATDRELALIMGLRTDRLTSIVFALGSSIAAVGAILVSFNTDIQPLMGFNALLFATVAVIVGGIGTTWGVYWGGLLVGLTQHLGVLHISTKWQQTITFVVLVSFLLLRPQGLFGRPLKRASV